MSSEDDEKKRVDQFYKLLADYGLTGRSQPLNKREQTDSKKLFSDEDE